MPRPQFSIRTGLADARRGDHPDWLGGIDEVNAAMERESMTFGEVAWMAAAYLASFVVLLRFRS